MFFKNSKNTKWCFSVSPAGMEERREGGRERGRERERERESVVYEHEPQLMICEP